MMDDAKPQPGVDDESWMDEMGWGDDAAAEPSQVLATAVPVAATGAAPKKILSRDPSEPANSASPVSAPPQLSCNAVCRNQSRPPSATIRNSYQRRLSIGAPSR